MEKTLTLEQKLDKAAEFVKTNQLLHAYQLYDSVLDENPSCIEALTGKAGICAITGKSELEIELLEEAINIDPENAALRMHFGQILLKNSNWEKAIDVLSYLLFSDELLVKFFVGYSYFMLQDYELAKINFTAFIENSEQDEIYYEAHLYLARIEIFLEDYQSALKHAKIAEVIFNNSWELHYVYAKAYYELDMLEHAMLPLKKAKKINPKEPVITELADDLDFKRGDFKKDKKSAK